MKTQTLIPSVNFHLWEPCNFSCKFCFATFQDVRKTILPKGHLPKEDALKIVDALADAGFSKITFAGGEPTLCPWLGDLIVRAKVKGLTTMIVTNGTGVTEKFLTDVDGFLDWVAISIDSILPLTNEIIGRAQGRRIVPNADWYIDKADLIKKHSVRLKINTVVNRYNFREYQLGLLIEKLQPERWKLFQVLPVAGQNDNYFEMFKINEKQLETFKRFNNVSSLNFPVITESNEEMRGTYAMVDPAGRFYDSTKGFHTYSKPILQVGVEAALQQVICNYEDFILRGGLYNWE